MTTSSQWPAAAETVPLAPRRTSGLAIAALVLSAVICCPVTTVLGIVMGLVAWFNVRRSPSLSGAGLALAAIVVGLAATIAQTSIAWWVWESMYRPMLYGPEDALTAAYAGDRPGFIEQFQHQAQQYSDADIDQFAAALRERYGAFGTAALDINSLPKGQPDARDVPAHYAVRFAKGNLTADASFTVPTGQAGAPKLRMLWLRINDPELGNLSFPPLKPGEEPVDGSGEGGPIDAPAGGG